jgi:hypothetical protein
VQCTAADGAGNSATGSFTVTVTAAEAPPGATGSIEGHGHVKSADGLVQFIFVVKQTADRLRGGLVVTMHKPRRATAVGMASLERAQFTGNQVSFTADGSWKGRRGFTFEVTALDGGRGFKNDTFALVVRSANGTVVASVRGRLHGGNITMATPKPALPPKPKPKPSAKRR